MEGNLVVRDLTQQFGGLTALNKVNMKVDVGEIVGVIGPNGAGKTTLFNIITGVYTPTSGEVYLNGERIDGKKPYEITELGFARTFQNIRLFKQLPAIDNVIVAMRLRSKCTLFDQLFNTKNKKAEMAAQMEKAEEILRIMDLENYKFDLPGSLPYGEQRRLEIARAMATDAKILLLDEPAAGMNEQETSALVKTVRHLNEMGYTIIIIEHDMKFIMNICERIYVLNHGELIAEGVPDEIKKNPDVIEAYLGKEEEE